MYVAEMRDYPFGIKEGEKPQGKIRLLEDTDGDGRYDRSHVFADELLWPTGVVPYKQGVFVAAAPNIYYLEDTDGDGRADIRRIVYAGFGTQNEQGSVNNLAWGLDGKIYASTSKNGGRIRTGKEDKSEPVSISGRDIAFDPVTEKFELITGGGQFGNAFDDWGNRFLCDESDPSIEVMLPSRYLARNPLLVVSNPVNDLCPGVTPIFRISPLEGWRVVRSSRRKALGERPETSSGLNHNVLDGTAGLTIYRGDAYPSEFRGNLIVGDGQTNLVHRRLLVPDGVTFRSLRADENTEFVRSRDIWFRPVNSFNSPDGCVFVTDMAREVIESVHVPWDVVTRINLKSQGRGRIYRIAPDGFKSPAMPRLSKASTVELVAALESRNGWHRDTAQRLLRERQDQSAVEPLRKLVAESSFDLARMHALYTLAQLNALADADLEHALADSSAGVREHAVRLAETRLSSAPPVLAAVLRLAEDESPRVRFQVAFSLGEVRSPESAAQEALSALAKIARRDGNDVWVRSAILSSVSGRGDALLVDLVGADASAVAKLDSALVRQLAFLVAREEGRDSRVGRLLDQLASTASAEVAPATWQPILLGLADGLRGSGSSLPALRPTLSPAAATFVSRVVDDAAKTAADSQAVLGARSQAILTLGCGDFDLASQTLAPLLSPHEAELVARAAVQCLATFDQPQVATTLLAPWRQYTPALRDAVAQALFARPQWLAEFVAAIERGDVSPNHVTKVQRSILLAHRDPAVRARAEQLFEVDRSPRKEIYERYRPALDLTADAAAGERVYERECMACHQIGLKGQAVGPNLALTKHRAPEELLMHILDPNREVQPAFIQYVAVDRSGGIYTGLIAAETANSITLRRDKGIEQSILKSEIDEISSSDKSLMPEGFEKTIDQQQMADLLAFLKALHYDIGTNPGRHEGDK